MRVLAFKVLLFLLCVFSMGSCNVAGFFQRLFQQKSTQYGGLKMEFKGGDGNVMYIGVCLGIKDRFCPSASIYDNGRILKYTCEYKESNGFCEKTGNVIPIERYSIDDMFQYMIYEYINTKNENCSKMIETDTNFYCNNSIIKERQGEWGKIGEKKIRIAVVGDKKSGKTVLYNSVFHMVNDFYRHTYSTIVNTIQYIHVINEDMKKFCSYDVEICDTPGEDIILGNKILDGEFEIVLVVFNYEDLSKGRDLKGFISQLKKTYMGKNSLFFVVVSIDGVFFSLHQQAINNCYPLNTHLNTEYEFYQSCRNKTGNVISVCGEYIDEQKNIIVEKNEEVEGKDGNVNNKKEHIFEKFAKIDRSRLGLVNIGATCYMNSVIQCFAHIEGFVDYFKYRLGNSVLSDKTLCYSVRRIICELWSENKDDKEFIEPRDFKDKISGLEKLFAGVKANDPKDLINSLIMQVAAETKKHNKMCGNNVNGIDQSNNVNGIDQSNFNSVMSDYVTNFKNNTSVCSDLFHFPRVVESDFIKCQSKVFTAQTYFCFSFPLKEVLDYKKKKQDK